VEIATHATSILAGNTMARMTQKLVNEIWRWTNQCYKEALIDAYPDFFTAKEIAEFDDYDMKYKLFTNDLDTKGEAIDQLYIKKILQLDSEKLNLIVESNKKGKIKRASTTIEAILTELLERSANSESRSTHE
jgi:hypothetical protein